MENHSAAADQTEGFRDPTRLTQWTRVFLCASIAMNLVRILVHGTLLRGEGVSPAPWWSYGIWELPVGLTTTILVLTWIHRANHNARQLGATKMRFTPGWAVGWYFVPIAWFWKPFEAMKEIWQASASPAYWWREPGSPLLAGWWALWILTFFVGDVITSTVQTFEMVSDPEVFESVVDLISEALGIPLTLLLLTIVGRVHRMQMENYRRQAAAHGA